MPTKRAPLNRPLHARITPELVELYRRVREICDADLDDLWEEEGGRRGEFLDTNLALNRGLGLKPWDYEPAFVPLDGPPRAWERPESFGRAQELARALEAASAEMGGARRRQKARPAPSGSRP